MIRPRSVNIETSLNPFISLALKDCLAKTYVSEDGSKLPGRRVLNHCHIVGSVAKEIIARTPIWLRADLFPPGSELIAACHDLGKVSPTFQEKIYRGCNLKSGLEGINPDLEKAWGGHAGVSLATAQALSTGKYIPEILGQHHGYFPDLAGKAAQAEVFGGVSWQEQRAELLQELKQSLQCDFPIVNSPLHAQVLAGLTTVSDWIGSGAFFDDPAQAWEFSVNKALDSAGFVQPKVVPNLSFKAIFNFEPRRIQQTMIQSVAQPGVYILEAPMGIGKTEAALYAAYTLIQAGKATGLYFALPTQLTSNKIHDRVNDFLTKILAEDGRHREALLLHANAWLKQEMGVDGNPNGSWFQAAKRGILAPFAVGTIDQALMAVMNVKHGFVRTFGLAGKVVVLDEVHSYDAYTGTILDRLVADLRKLHCTVIILSATLTQKRRQELLQQPVVEQCYPLVSVAPNQGAFQELSVEFTEMASVTIHCYQQDQAVRAEALSRAEQSQQVLWIENTVAEAQEQYRILASRASDMGLECGLLHSRFLKTDREMNENHWVKLYGKDNAAERQVKGRILVGTQVLEQSLDIDADFLVTRIAPTDMLLQRLGRLWRHSSNNAFRPASAVREAWILAPDLKLAIENPKQQFGKTAFVYSPYVLCRSLAVWHELKSVTLPQHIRPLVEATYAEQTEVGLMRQYQVELDKVREKLGRMALVGLSQGGKTLPENKTSTRYSEQDSVEVLLLRSVFTDKSGTTARLLNNKLIYLPRNIKVKDKQQWRDLAGQLVQNTVQVADYLAPTALAMVDATWLKDYFYLGNKAEGESLLRIALVNDSNEIRGLNGGLASTDRQLNYDAKLGYQAEKINPNKDKHDQSIPF